MAYSIVALKEKILEMYPEISQARLSAAVTFNEEKNTYVITFSRANSVLTTHLDKKDADECMSGVKCVYLGVQVAQFIRNFSEREAFERNNGQAV